MRHKFQEDPTFTDDMPFGEFIRKKRRLMGYSQTDFAEYLGVSLTAISQWELRATSPPIEMASEIVSMLGGEILIINNEVAK